MIKNSEMLFDDLEILNSKPFGRILHQLFCVYKPRDMQCNFSTYKNKQVSIAFSLVKSIDIMNFIFNGSTEGGGGGSYLILLLIEPNFVEAKNILFTAFLPFLPLFVSPV